METRQSNRRPTAAEVRAMILAARTGSREDLAKVLEVFRPYLVLRSLAKLDRRVQMKVAPSDAAQETIVKAMHGFSRFRGQDLDSLLKWLNRIHTRCLIDVHRRFRVKKRRVLGEFYLDDPHSREFLVAVAQVAAKEASPSEELQRRDLEHQVRQAFQYLTTQQRQALELRYVEGLSSREIGVRLGIQPSAARQACVRGIQSLGQRLREMDS